MATSPVLVIGADGLVGGALSSALGTAGRHAIQTTRRHGVRDGSLFLDLADPEIDQIPLPYAGTAVFCAGLNGFAACRADRAAARQVNVRAPEILARRLIAQDCRVIYLSSSAVFDFRRPHLAAETPVCPTTVYGELKAEGETTILALGEMASVVRLTKILAPQWQRFTYWLDALRNKQRVAVYTDLHFCPVAADFAAKALIRIIDNCASGIYQISGADDISYFAALRHVAKRTGLDTTLVVPDQASAHGVPPEEIAQFTSLDTSRYTALSGESPPLPYDVLDAVSADARRQLVF